MKLTDFLRERRMQLSLLLILLLAVLQSALTILFTYKKDHMTDEAAGLSRSNLFIEEKFNDHLRWANELIESLATGKEFTGELDRNKTEFGQWYFSFEGSREYWALDQERKSVFDSIGPVSLALSNSARLMYGTDSREEKLGIYLSDTKQALNELQTLLSRYISLNHAVQERKKAALDRFTTVFRIASLSIFAMIIAAIGFLGYGIYRSIIRGTGMFVRAFDRLAQGDLTEGIDRVSHDEYGIVIRQYNGFITRVSHVVNTVRVNAENLSVSSSRMNEIVTSFADASHQQASITEEINSSMTQINDEMKRISTATAFQSECLSSLIAIIDELSAIITAMNARMTESRVTVTSISEDATTGETMLEQMKTSMHTIGKSSEEITGIVSIINDISDQINLLSLNAAIEAARAGDSGRGFAIVAHEITKLAARTAESISNIDALVQRNKVETLHAVSRVSKSSEKIRKIIDGVNSIQQIIASINSLMQQQSDINARVHDEAENVRQRDIEIQAAVGQQQRGIDEITASISHITDLTQENAFGMTEIAERIENLESMSSELLGDIDFFTVK